MRNISRTQGLLGFTVCTVLLTMAGNALLHTRQSAETDEKNQVAKIRMVSRSEPLARALLPHVSKFETATYMNTTFTSSGQAVHHLSVDCSDPVSGDNAHLMWNTDTGELVRASRFRQTDRNGELNEKSPRKIALNLAWDWFHAMKIDRRAEEWRIVGARQKPYAQWDIYFQSGDRCAIVTVSTCSGQLVQAVCSRLTDANVAWMPRNVEAAS